MLIRIDFRKAFDNLWWTSVINRLIKTKCPSNITNLMKNYLSKRTAGFYTNNIKVEVEVTRGCPQGSRCGPGVWNLVLDELLEQQEDTEELRIQAYADDTLIMVAHKNCDRVAEIANNTLTKIWTWSNKHRLPINYEKCEAIVITRKNKRSQLKRAIGVKIHGKGIKNVQQMKYLGIVFNRTLNWQHHINYVCNKATERSNQLSSITRNTWGLHPKHTKTIYLQAIEPAVLYGVQIWNAALDRVHVKRKLLSIQRKSAIRICRAYRTSPTDALLVISNLTPIHLKGKQITWEWTLFNKNFADISESDIEQLQKRGNLPPDNTKDISRFIQSIDHKLKNKDLQIDPRMRCPYKVLLEYDNTTNQENEQLITIYTDGSKDNQGVGSGLIIKKGNKTMYQAAFRLTNECTITQAELWVIYKAISYIKQLNLTMPKKITIFTDSKVALYILKTIKNSSALAVDLIALAHDLGQQFEILFQWIPSHSGYRGNKLADKLANKARTNSNITYTRFPVNHVYRYIRQEIRILWQGEWDKSNTRRQCYKFIPSIERRQKTKVSTQATNSHNVSVDTGHSMPT
ncbi:uncharacterized protein LOC111633023 [Centruroides sculpturatus]|uniref:uncharacterized protein LOC111633023 n=1 Tax=Centruroides sculpturatus TaxID=218467 RepID=UPI000C6D2EF9|nr:uncharacterized protein LOC111633023 [Centruroides sculpturatus]